MPIDELELLEQMRQRIGMPPLHMIEQAHNRNELFDDDNKLRRSKQSKMVAGISDRQHSVRKVLLKSGENNEDFIDFIERCLMIDPVERMTPQ